MLKFFEATQQAGGRLVRTHFLSQVHDPHAFESAVCVACTHGKLLAPASPIANTVCRCTCAWLVILQIECYTNMEQSLQDQDLVLSCEDPGAWGQLHNAAMASTPGHPFWLAVLQEAVRRSPATAAANSSWLTQQLRKLWRQTPFHDRIVDVLQSTGPMLLSDVYQVGEHCGTLVISRGVPALTEQLHQVLGYDQYQTQLAS